MVYKYINKPNRSWCWFVVLSISLPFWWIKLLQDHFAEFSHSRACLVIDWSRIEEDIQYWSRFMIEVSSLVSALPSLIYILAHCKFNSVRPRLFLFSCIYIYIRRWLKIFLVDGTMGVIRMIEYCLCRLSFRV